MRVGTMLLPNVLGAEPHPAHVVATFGPIAHMADWLVAQRHVPSLLGVLGDHGLALLLHEALKWSSRSQMGIGTTVADGIQYFLNNGGTLLDGQTIDLLGPRATLVPRSTVGRGKNRSSINGIVWVGVFHGRKIVSDGSVSYAGLRGTVNLDRTNLSVLERAERPKAMLEECIGAGGCLGGNVARIGSQARYKRSNARGTVDPVDEVDGHWKHYNRLWIRSQTTNGGNKNSNDNATFYEEPQDVHDGIFAVPFPLVQSNEATRVIGKRNEDEEC
jgi:hypothetical protein